MVSGQNKRVLINTLAQYIKSVINILLSLYSTRLVLDALHVSDYGIYSVVAGVVGMLGFITNALVITTQRFLSFSYGKNDIKSSQVYFVNSLFLHVVIASVICLILYLLRNNIIGMLTIEISRVPTATIVFVYTIIMLFTSIVVSPFKALFVAKENIVLMAVIEVLDGVVKLILALILSIISIDKLVFYAQMMCVILFVDFAAYVLFAFFKYDELKLKRTGYLSWNVSRQLLGFVGWTTYGMGIITLRTQGSAVVLNHFYGTVINAAYGIAYQIYGAITFVATSVLNAMNPQIIKEYGKGDNARMIALASRESKVAEALMLIISLPIIFELPYILEIWLKEVPENTSMFCRMVIIMFLADQVTYGLNTVNQATGNIRLYSLIMYTPKLLSLVAGAILLYFGYSPFHMMVVYLIVEILVSMSRLPYMHYVIGLDVMEFVKKVFLPLFPLLISLCVLHYFLSDVHICKFDFVFRMIISVCVGVVVFAFATLSKNERKSISEIIRRKVKNE